jgi:hypothetical protein
MDLPRNVPIEKKQLGNGRVAYVGHSVAGKINGVAFIVSAADPLDLAEIWDRIMGNAPAPKLEDPLSLNLAHCLATATVARTDLWIAGERFERLIK